MVGIRIKERSLPTLTKLWTMAVCGREKERRERKKKGEKCEAAVVFNLRVRLNG